MDVRLLEGLTPDQRAAAICLDHCLVVAGPGTGKTKTMAAKAAFLLSDPNVSVATVTFSKDASTELQERILAITGEDATKRLLCGTFHGLSLKLLRRIRNINVSSIASEGEQMAVAQRALDEVGLSYTPAEALQRIDAARALQNTSEEQLSVSQARDRELSIAYLTALGRNGKIDFSELLHSAVAGLESGVIAPFKVDYILADEYQDVDSMQYRFLCVHARAASKITIVGDDDQAIFSWRNAMGYAGMELFASDCHASRFVLGTNFRCRAEILSDADRLIRGNSPKRIPKTLIASRGRGGSVSYLLNEFDLPVDEAKGVRDAAEAWVQAEVPYSFAVIARNNNALSAIEGALSGAHPSRNPGASDAPSPMAPIPYMRATGRSIFESNEATVFMDLMEAACSEKTKGLDHALNWAGISGIELKAIHDATGNKFDRGLDKKIPPGTVSASNTKLWRHFSQVLDGWRRSVELPQIGHDLAFNGINAWMQEHAPSTESGNPSSSQTLVGILGRAFAATQGSLDLRVKYFRDLIRRQKDRAKNASDPRIVLTTMHSAKGLEWDQVWVIRAEENVCPSNRSEDISEDRRLFYVAMTRARDQLIVSRTNDNPVSRFVYEAQPR